MCNAKAWRTRQQSRKRSSRNRLGYPELIVRSVKERLGDRAVAQAPPKCDSASAGVGENAIKQVTGKVRTLVIATRELDGVVMDPEHVA